MEQDGNEEGLSLLRFQMERVGYTSGTADQQQHLGHKLENGVVQIVDRTGACIGTAINAQWATAICRMMDLGWMMINELEPPAALPETPDESGRSEPTKKES